MILTDVKVIHFVDYTITVYEYNHCLYSGELRYCQNVWISNVYTTSKEVMNVLTTELRKYLGAPVETR